MKIYELTLTVVYKVGGSVVTKTAKKRFMGATIAEAVGKEKAYTDKLAEDGHNIVTFASVGRFITIPS